MKVNEMIDMYLERIKLIRDDEPFKSEFYNYQSIKRCFVYLKIKRVKQLTYKIYNDYILYWKTQTKCKNSTINKYTTYIKTTLRYFNLLSNTFLQVKKLKDDTVHYKPINKDDFIDLLGMLEYEKNENTKVYKMVIRVMYSTGCRIDELLKIKIKNINFKDESILLEKTKSKK